MRPGPLNVRHRVPPLPAHNPVGGRIERDPTTGEPTGVFTDVAMTLITDYIPKPTHDETIHALTLALSSLSHHGLTAIHDRVYLNDNRLRDALGETGRLVW